MDLLVAPFKGDTEDPALILAATYTTAIKSAQVRSRFVSFSTRLRRSVHALHGDGIYRNFFVNTKSPKAPIQPLSGGGGMGWGGEVKSVEDPGRRIVFHRVFPGYIDFSYFDSVDLRGTKRTIFGENEFFFFTRMQVMNVFAFHFFFSFFSLIEWQDETVKVSFEKKKK